MTPNQFRAALKRLKLSQRGAARLFGINERTARRYALKGPVSERIAGQLADLVSGKITIKDVETTNGKD